MCFFNRHSSVVLFFFLFASLSLLNGKVEISRYLRERVPPWQQHYGNSAFNDVYGGRVAKKHNALLVLTLSFWKCRYTEQAPWTARDLC